MVPDGAGFLATTPDAAGLAAEVRRLRTDPAAITRASRAALAARSRVEQPTAALLDVYGSVRGV